MSSSIPPICSIVENPDIAGIGVRLSIYLPALLVTLNSGFVMAKLFVDVFTGKLSEYVPPTPPKTSLDMDGHNRNQSGSGSDIELADLGEAMGQPTPSIDWSQGRESYDRDLRWFQGYLSYLSDHPHYFESAKSLERSLFLIGSAIIVSAFLDARYVTSNIGLPPYHALLVLNLSLINNLAGSSFLWFRIGALFATMELEFEENQFEDDDPEAKGLMSKTLWWSLRFFDLFGLSTLQTLVFIAFGIWFWMETTLFHEFSGYSMTVGKLLSSTAYNSSVAASSDGPSDPSQCVTRTFYWAFLGLRIESMLSIQVVSLIFYIGTAAVPFLGPLVTIVPSVVLFRSVPQFMGLIFSAAIYLVGIVLPRVTTRLAYFLLPKLYRLSITIAHPHPSQPLFPRQLSPSAISTKVMFAAIMVTNLCTVLFLIISTENTIFINAASNSNEGTVVINGRQWTYGQTLALLTAVIGVAMYGAEVVGYWREAWIERRKRMGENTDRATIAGDVEDTNGQTDQDGDKDDVRTYSPERLQRKSLFHMKRRASSI